ncbi:DNA polymerase IV [Candidatus Parcubacteria bacterium]|nr:MAG: DNA polymerase IV [Candidatus Parcubacteria bacterium]
MKIIAHIDMDAFFAAVEERDRPGIKGMPIVVGSDPAGGTGRGVVSTANYAARKYGIFSATPISKAWKLSEKAKKEGKPGVIFLEVDFAKYGAVSRKIMEIVGKHSPIVEEASIDEAYFDLSHAGSYEKAKEVCQKIKAEIREKENLTASVGIGPNKLIAKIASGFQKPDGLTIVEEKDAEDFLAEMPARALPGVGPKTEILLKGKGIEKIKDIKKFSKDQLEEILGKWGIDLYYKARGIGETELVTEYEAKSIGEQETFMKDTLESNFLFERLAKAAERVFERFKRSEFKSFKTVGITVRFSDFETKTSAHTMKEPANSQGVLKKEALKLLMPYLDSRKNPKKKLIRLLGIRITQFQ